MNQQNLFYTGIGKRKTSVAKVFLKEGPGIIKVNEKNFDQFFAGLLAEINFINSPFKTVNLVDKYDIDIRGHEA